MTSLEDIQAPKAPQLCLNCGAIIKTYQEWFTLLDCPITVSRSHNVANYLALPHKEAPMATVTDPGALLDTYAGALADLDRAKQDVADLEFKIFQLIDAVPGRLILPNFMYTCEIVPPPNSYDYSKMVPLKELLGDDLESCWELVDKWDMTKTKAAAKRQGDRAVAVIEDAKKSPTTRGKLKFEKKNHGN